MYIGFQHLHSFLAYVVLIALVITVGLAKYNWLINTSKIALVRKASLVSLILSHTMLVLGLILYFISPLGWQNFSAEAMKEAITRLYAVEHPFTMIVAILVITFGYSRAKRLTDDRAVSRNVTWYYGVGLLLILSRIPWQAWLG